MRRLLPLLFAGIALLRAAPGFAAGQATPDEAKAMTIKAAAYLQAVGPDKAFPEFNAKDGPWHDRDLYVTVEDASGIMLVNGANPGLLGKNVLDLRDPDGKPFQREMSAITGTGWVNYRWLNPVSHAIEPKTIYIIRVGDYTVGVGAYVQ